MHTITHKIAVFISYLFHPLLMTTYLFAVIAILSPPIILPIHFTPTKSIILVTLIFIATFIIPVLSLFMLKKLGKITSFLLENRKERITPIAYIFVMHTVTSYLFNTKIELGGMISILLATTSLLIIITLAITLFWKISLHTIGIGGLIGLILSLNQHTKINDFKYLLPILFFVGALIATARFKLNVHSPAQVYIGFILGIAINFTIFTIYLNL